MGFATEPVDAAHMQYYNRVLHFKVQWNRVLERSLAHSLACAREYTHIVRHRCVNKSLLAACHSIGWRASEQSNEIFDSFPFSPFASVSIALSAIETEWKQQLVASERKKSLKQGPKVKSHFCLHCSAFRDKNKWDKQNSETRTLPILYWLLFFSHSFFLLLLFWSCCSLFAIPFDTRVKFIFIECRAFN